MTVLQADGRRPTEERRRSDRTGFRPDVEGLRAVAVVAVVLFHAEMPGLGGGYVGVDVFFVISGFLITGLLWREANSTGVVRLSRFYGARARRLLPASALVGVITMIASVLLLPPLRIPAVLHDGIASALYVGNYWFILDEVNYFTHLQTPSPFQHYWSLGVEEQFYLVWPALIIATAWVLPRVSKRTKAEATSSQRPYVMVLAGIAAVSFALSLATTYVLPAVVFFSLPTRAWQLALGGLVALTADHWRQISTKAGAVAGWSGLAAIVLACVWFSAATPYPGIAALLPTLGTALVIGAGCAVPSQGCGRALAASPMRAIGRISYSWYLWHWPFLVLAPALLGHPLGLAERIALALLTAVLAELTLRLVENPIRYARLLRRSPLASLALGGAVTAITVCVGAALTTVVPTPVGHGPAVIPLQITAAPVPDGAPIEAYEAAARDALAELQAALHVSVGLTAVPSNLQPPLVVEAAKQIAPGAEQKSSRPFKGCLLEATQVAQPECATGDTASTDTVAVIGDSHAATWIPAFRRIAEARRWRLELLAKMGCPLMPNTSPLGFAIERVYHCGQWSSEIIARLRAERPKLVVISIWRGYGINERSSGFHAFDPSWTEGMTRIVRQLRSSGIQVLVLGPIPNPYQPVPICLSGHLDEAAACSLPRSTAVNLTGIAAESAATEAGGGQYLDVTDLFCAAERCPVIVGNTLVYLDFSHMTNEYSRILAPVVGALIDLGLARS